MNIKQQRKKIKALQQTSYRFKKKMKSLKDLVQQLRKQDLITENAAQILLVFLNNFNYWIFSENYKSIDIIQLQSPL